MKPDYSFRNINLWNIDCMEFMKDTPDKYYELAIVDPPYGIGMDKTHFITKSSKTNANDYGQKKWDSVIPDKDYFIEIKRVSKNQIIWGVNYFNDLLGGRIVWDKDNGNSIHSDCELAYQSFTNSVRKVKIKWHGMLQQNMKEKEQRIHPTQKPIQLYEWILEKYAKSGDKIFDSHGGSFSLACACLDLGFSFDGTEIDKEYFDNAVKRIKNHNQEFLSL